MNMNNSDISGGDQTIPVRLPCLLIATSILLCLASMAGAQSYNFDNNSDAGWQNSGTATYPATFTLVPDGAGGKAYRLQASSPSSSGEVGQVNMARAIAVRTEQTYTTSFYVAADLVGWDTNTYSATNDAVIGLIARASNVTTPDQTQGVMLLTHWNQYDNGERGSAQIYALLFGGGYLIPGAQGNFTIARGHSYRMVFSGTNNVLSGSFYDLQDLTRPLVTFTCDDSYAPGFFPTSGYSGVMALGYRGSTAVNQTSADATFDNVVIAATPPSSVPAPAVPNGLSGVAQVVNRAPASSANFYPAAAGISFNATTLTSTNQVNTNAIKLFLNGVNVSGGLSISGATTNATVSFNGLSPNSYYEARVELQDVLGRKTTNSWNFDTFTQAYLASSGAKNIECEEYDFAGGQFYDSPVVSGYATNFGPGVNVGSANTYADQGGLPGVDFFDWDGSAHSQENEFRSGDPVGTQQGSMEFQYALENNVWAWRNYDTLRQKYLDAQPDGSLVECGVERTEGQEWLNYTRIFQSANSYNVYLRHGSAAAQTWSLDRIGAEPSTNSLGKFNCENAFTRSNFRDTPLVDATGGRAVVRLTGTNTLRLTLDNPHTGPVKQGIWLNYLAFVPAEPQVFSSAQANGPYVPEPSQLFDSVNHRLTVPQGGAAKFYRVGWKTPIRITGISLTNGNVILSY